MAMMKNPNLIAKSANYLIPDVIDLCVERYERELSKANLTQQDCAAIEARTKELLHKTYDSLINRGEVFIFESQVMLIVNPNGDKKKGHTTKVRTVNPKGGKKEGHATKVSIVGPEDDKKEENVTKLADALLALLANVLRAKGYQVLPCDGTYGGISVKTL